VSWIIVLFLNIEELIKLLERLKDDLSFLRIRSKKHEVYFFVSWERGIQRV
jgi:hypothetical protein